MDTILTTWAKKNRARILVALTLMTLLTASIPERQAYLPDTSSRQLLGTTFSPLAFPGLTQAEVDAAWRNLLASDTDLIRLGAYWSEIDSHGYADLDSRLDSAAEAGKAVMLTVGAKAPRWPEYYVPPRLAYTLPGRSGTVGLDPHLREEIIGFVAATVERYRDHRAVVAWQVENEPLDAAGPHRWRLDPSLLAAEVAVVRFLDPGRPIALTFFLQLGTSCGQPLDPIDCDVPRAVFGPPQDAAAKLLPMLRPGDILGADVYTAIGLSHVPGDWRTQLRVWSRLAEREGIALWITELQAEPWETESTHPSEANATVVTVERTGALLDAANGSRASAILLWGFEHWWLRSRQADDGWLRAADRWLGPR